VNAGAAFGAAGAFTGGITGATGALVETLVGARVGVLVGTLVGTLVGATGAAVGANGALVGAVTDLGVGALATGATPVFWFTSMAEIFGKSICKRNVVSPMQREVYIMQQTTYSATYEGDVVEEADCKQTVSHGNSVQDSCDRLESNSSANLHDIHVFNAPSLHRYIKLTFSNDGMAEKSAKSARLVRERIAIAPAEVS
jgi:hypothetical protein